MRPFCDLAPRIRETAARFGEALFIREKAARFSEAPFIREKAARFSEARRADARP